MKMYREILQQFSNNGVNYVAIGTWALKHAFPEKMKEYRVNDCDIFIKHNISTIRTLIKILDDNIWKVSLWEKVIDEDIKIEDLKGKYYLRAKKDDCVMDITYESQYISWIDLLRESSQIKNCTIASLHHILSLKRIKGTEKDLQVVRMFEGEL
jgi:hypothetical protein